MGSRIEPLAELFDNECKNSAKDGERSSIDLDQDKWRDLEKARTLLLSGQLTPLEIAKKTQIPHQTVKNLRQKLRHDPDALNVVSWIRVETLAQLFDNECKSSAKDDATKDGEL